MINIITFFAYLLNVFQPQISPQDTVSPVVTSTLETVTPIELPVETRSAVIPSQIIMVPVILPTEVSSSAPSSSTEDPVQKKIMKTRTTTQTSRGAKASGSGAGSNNVDSGSSTGIFTMGRNI